MSSTEVQVGPLPQRLSTAPLALIQRPLLRVLHLLIACSAIRRLTTSPQNRSTTVTLHDGTGQHPLTFELCDGVWRVSAHAMWKGPIGAAAAGWLKEDNIRRAWLNAFAPNAPPSQLLSALLRYSPEGDSEPTQQLSLDAAESMEVLLRVAQLAGAKRVALARSFTPVMTALLRSAPEQTDADWVAAFVGRDGAKLRLLNALMKAIIDQ